MIDDSESDTSRKYIDELMAFLPQRDLLEAAIAHDEAQGLLSVFERTTIWCGHLELAFRDNPAVGILYALHSKVLETYVLVPLGLLHAAYATLRSILDMACSWSFFVSHSVELTSVVAGRAGWMGRSKILEWHALHSPGCETLKSSMFPQWETLYRDLSAFVHCLPGSTLPDRVRVSDWKLEGSDVKRFVDVAQKTDAAINELFLGCFAPQVNHMSRHDAVSITRGYKGSVLGGLGIAAL